MVYLDGILRREECRRLESLRDGRISVELGCGLKVNSVSVEAGWIGVCILFSSSLCTSLL